MKIRTTLPRLGEVQAARARVTAARTRWARTRLRDSALAIEAHAHGHPLACIGVAAGAGLALGWLAVRPWRIAGVTGLLYRQATPWIARLMAMTRDAEVD